MFGMNFPFFMQSNNGHTLPPNVALKLEAIAKANDQSELGVLTELIDAEFNHLVNAKVIK